MDAETKVAAMKRFACEIVTESELLDLFSSEKHPIAYDGFEPSGVAPVHFGLLRAKNLRTVLGLGIKFKLYLADYFAFINNKLGGDLEKIKNAGNYFVEVWKAAGVDTSKVEIIWANELMQEFRYWDRFLRVGKGEPLERIKRAITIAGRHEGEKISAAQLFYPVMQVTDIFQMNIDICQLGIDQRRANMLAREAAKRYKWNMPIAVHHPLMLGLHGIPKGTLMKDESSLIEFKMSKSQPSTCIYMHDTLDQLTKKINGAYCPERLLEGNPIINYLDTLLIDDKSSQIAIDRPQKFGGPLEFNNYQELIGAYTKGALHPTDLKAFVIREFEKRIKPVREHFETHKAAKELYEQVKSYGITR